MISIKDIMYLGKYVRIVNCSDATKINASGLVIDETKNMLVIRLKNKKEIKIIKNEIIKIEVMSDFNEKRSEK